MKNGSDRTLLYEFDDTITIHIISGFAYLTSPLNATYKSSTPHQKSLDVCQMCGKNFMSILRNSEFELFWYFPETTEFKKSYNTRHICHDCITSLVGGVDEILTQNVSSAEILSELI